MITNTPIKTFEDMIAFLKYCIQERDLTIPEDFDGEEDQTLLETRYSECTDFAFIYKVSLYNIIDILVLQNTESENYKSFEDFLKQTGARYECKIVENSFVWRISNHNGFLIFNSSSEDINEAMASLCAYPPLSAYDEACQLVGQHNITEKVIAECTEYYEQKMYEYEQLKEMFSLKQLAGYIALHNCGDRL